MTQTIDDRRTRAETLILVLLCAAQFMVILDVSIVNVALESIRHALGFSSIGLQWVVNAYTIAFGGFLLLGGRAADFFGRRRVFLIGLGLFTGASLLGGFAQDQAMLVSARIIQGLGGAVLSPATLTLLITTFPEGPKRARALGAWSALAGAGGAAGALAGGILTDTVGWRWILFVNVPIGVAAIIAGRAWLTNTRDDNAKKLDIVGAILVTASLMALVYGIVNTDVHPWGSGRTLATIGAAVVLMIGFLVHETKIAHAPLMPMSLFKSRSISAANLSMFMLGGAIFASWYFLSLYMQAVLGYSPLRAGLGFLPQTLSIIIAAQISSRLVTRIGPRPILIVAPVISTIGLLWLGRIDVGGTFWSTLFVPSVLITIGMGLAFPALAMAATAGVPPQLAGLSSGLINTTRQVGGAIGLAALATVATSHTDALLKAGVSVGAATARGYGRAFVVSSGVAIVASLAAAALPAIKLPPRPAAVLAEEAIETASETVAGHA